MKTIAALLILALLPGCASVDVNHVLDNLSKDCQRDYQGAIGGVGQGTFSFNIHCTPEGTTTTTTVTVTPPKPAGTP